MKFLLQQHVDLNIYHGNLSWNECVNNINYTFGDEGNIERSLENIEENIKKIISDDNINQLDNGMLMMLNKKFDDVEWDSWDDDLLRENVDLFMMEDEMYDDLNKHINLTQQNLGNFRSEKCKWLYSIDTETYFNNLGMEGTMKCIKQQFFSSYVEKLKGGYVDPSFGKTMEMFMDELKDFDIEVIYTTHCFDEEKDYVCYQQKLDITSGEEMMWLLDSYVENDMRMNWKTYDLRKPLNGEEVKWNLKFENKKR